MIEFVSVYAMFIGGCALLRVVGIRGWALPFLGLLAGVATYVAVGVAQVVVPFVPTSPVITLAVTAVGPAAWWLWHWRRGGDVHVAPPWAAAGLAGLGAAVGGFRLAGLVTYHTDSFTYLMAARMLADDTYKSDISRSLVTNRTLGVPLLHAPANLAGEFYLVAITPVLAVATVGALVWLFRRGVARPAAVATASRTALVVLGVALLVTNNRVVFNAFYLNGHLLQAALVLLVVGSGWLLVTDAPVPRRAVATLQLIAIPGLIVTRPEGLLIAVLALLPTWVSGVPARHRSLTLAVAGVFGTGWYAFQIWVYLDRGGGLPISLVGPALLAVVLLPASLVPTRWSPSTRQTVVALWTAEAMLWSALLVAAVRDPRTLYVSVYHTGRNLVGGEGRWGLSLVLLGCMAVAALLMFRPPHQIFLRFPLTTFVPLALLLAYLRGGPYRSGYGDSLNRMWMHVVPLAVLYVIVAAAMGRGRARSAGAEAPPAPEDLPAPRRDLTSTAAGRSGSRA
jgi:hypothetical protein